MDPVVKKAIEEENVNYLAYYKFGYILTEGQEELVRAIAFWKFSDICVSAMTRWGKSQMVAIGLALLIWLNGGIKIAFIGPKDAQAAILRQYLTELIFVDKTPGGLLSMAQLTSTGDERIVTESSKKRMTFNNGSEYRVFSAEGDANRLMGFGANIVAKDEACLIKKAADAKILRMLGDSPEKYMLIELFNPWNKDNSAYEHTLNENVKYFRIPWQQAVKEGRTTVKFVDKMRDELTPLDFTVLYDSEFPDQSEDSIFSTKWYNACSGNKFTLWDEVLNLRKTIKELEKKKEKTPLIKDKKIVEAELKEVRDLLKEYKIMISCDPADKGLDWTVIFWGVIHGSQYQITGYYSEATSDNMAIASKMLDIHREIGSTHWNIDGHGLGTGVLSRGRQLNREMKLGIHIKSCLFGGAATNKDVYRNLKAEEYFHLAKIMKEERIDLIDIRELKRDIMKMLWKKVSEKTIIVDPDKSPDYSDGLVYFTWKGARTMTFF